MRPTGPQFPAQQHIHRQAGLAIATAAGRLLIVTPDGPLAGKCAARKAGELLFATQSLEIPGTGRPTLTGR
jgi:hypothetical protein